jgi:pyruvate/2-oxoglutarate dehydrogenase complex dihydrolipoamide acyltransferase (E2) component
LPAPTRAEGVSARSAAPPGASNAGGTTLGSPTRTLGWVTRIESAALGKLSPSMRERIGRHRDATLVGAACALGVLLLAVGLGARALFHGTERQASSTTALETPPPESAATPVAAQPASTTTSGPASKSLDEPAVLLALADARLAEHHDADVPALAARLITRHPELIGDDRLKRILLATASSTDARAAADSFALLTGPMGEAGAALVYELSLKSDLHGNVRARALNWLLGKEFERVSALPVYAAVKLRNAKSCEDKRDLLDFAAQAGGSYVLDYLKELEQKTSCGPDDLEHCYPCLQNDNRLTETIAKLTHN